MGTIPVDDSGNHEFMNILYRRVRIVKVVKKKAYMT